MEKNNNPMSNDHHHEKQFVLSEIQVVVIEKEKKNAIKIRSSRIHANQNNVFSIIITLITIVSEIKYKCYYYFLNKRENRISYIFNTY